MGRPLQVILLGIAELFVEIVLEHMAPDACDLHARQTCNVASPGSLEHPGPHRPRAFHGTVRTRGKHAKPPRAVIQDGMSYVVIVMSAASSRNGMIA